MRLEAREHEHVDDLTLDAARAGELGLGDAAHLGDCDACDDRLQRLSRLADAFVMETPDADVPPPRDAAIRRAARAAAARGRRRRVAMIAPVVAAIAAVGLFFVFRSADTRDSSATHATNVRAAAPLDVNADGRVDILDAFALARTLDAGAATQAAWDANGDHAVDRLDVDALAQYVVRVRPRAQEKL